MFLVFIKIVLTLPIF